jgi:CheY-like chemotaxis protein
MWRRQRYVCDLNGRRRVRYQRIFAAIAGTGRPRRGHNIQADEAIAVLERRTDIHTIITDINMPGSMDGLRLAAAVRNRWPPIKIIVVTGHRPPESDELPTNSLFVAKPYSAARMIAAVSELQ